MAKVVVFLVEINYFCHVDFISTTNYNYNNQLQLLKYNCKEYT